MLEDRPDALAEFHGELGWRPRTGLDDGPDIINSQALRSRRDYVQSPPPGVPRIAAFGDSFVYGSEVLTDQAWTSIIEQSRPNTEVLNYGVPGYGQDQIFLRFLAEGQDLEPTVVLFGVATPTLERLMKVASMFQAPGAPSYDFVKKPRFLLDGDHLTLAPNPLRRPSDFQSYLKDPSLFRELGAYDYWYEPLVYENWLFEYTRTGRLVFGGWTQIKRRFFDTDRPLKGPKGAGIFNESSTGFRILTLILERFVANALKWGMRPVVLLLPDGYSTERIRSGRSGIMDPVRKFCRDQGLAYIDVKDAFLAQSDERETSVWFNDNFHYSLEGNRIVADWIRVEIDRRKW